MITESDLQEAIAECQGERNPNANTCIKLAAYYTILNQMTDKSVEQEYPNYYGYSRDAGPNIINIDSDSEFSNIINGRDSDEIWPVIDELMETLKVMNPRLYNAVIRKLQ